MNRNQGADYTNITDKIFCMPSYNPRLNPVFGQMYRLSIVFLLHLEISLRMQTSRTYLRSFLACVDETAVTALPYYFAFLSENSSIFNVLYKSAVAFFVSFLCNGNITVHGGNFRKAFLLGNIGKVRIVQRPLFMFACSVNSPV